MARQKKDLLQADAKTLAAFKAETKKKGGRLVEQGPIHAWADVDMGFRLTGDFVAIRPGVQKPDSDMKPGHLLDIVNADTGEVETWGCPAILKYRLDQAQAEKGDSLDIMLAGQLPSRRGQPAWDFLVAVYPKQ